MTSFDNKEKAEENKYAHDKELEFKIYARYHSLLAAWAAQQMHLSAEKAEEYKEQLITYNLRHHNNDELLNKIKHDFSTHKVHVTDHEVREVMHKLHLDAKKQVGGH